jgi:hypothetical protein
MTARLVACLLFALSLSACSAEVEQKMPERNPEPKSAYKVELWAEHPPRPIQIDDVTASYQVADPSCLPRRPISGASAVSWNVEVPVELRRHSSERFAVTVFDDLLLPGDLYGEGRCEWRLVSVVSTWSDGVLAYRHSGVVRPFDGGEGIVRDYSVFARSGRGQHEHGLSLPLAFLMTTKVADEEYPTGYFEDRSRLPEGVEYTVGMPVPVRRVTPEQDFRLMSESRLADDS